jgi:hypothetical protein
MYTLAWGIGIEDVFGRNGSLETPRALRPDGSDGPGAFPDWNGYIDKKQEIVSNIPVR